MAIVLFLLYTIFSLIVLYRALNPVIWEVGSVVYLLATTLWVGVPWFAALPLWLIITAIILMVRIDTVRSRVLGLLYLRALKSIPTLSKTEEDALNAGDTWLEQSIFTGTPDWDKLAEVRSTLTPEEQSFIDQETETLCSMLDEWAISQAHDLPVSVWEYMKTKGFFGLVIDKAYGGKGFSARAHSDVVFKIASRSGVAAVTVMVPNSLGPGELLQHYGTDEQKAHYLPRLANGTDIPCFALTEPGAGSDATSIESEAIVIEKQVDGKTVLGLRMTLNKRWITLSPVATLIGLAVYLKDPDGLLQGEGAEGITCVLISRDTAGLEIGNRHLPANQPFMNGTIRGEGIFAPLSAIIGGPSMAGKGWQMLVECLSIGRSISLPALATASSSIAYLTTGAFARLRRQFKVEIGQFEGVEEKLAEIAGLNYIINATRLLTVAAVNEHKKPSVASAITKYFNTELARIVINDAMDVHAGRAVVVGPRNYLSNYYQGLPISITVEGANIMSRNLLIFGQGSMACHPYIRDEFYAISNKDKAGFEQLMWKHIHYFMRNLAKTVCTAWTGGLLIAAPRSPLKCAYKRLTRLSYAFAWMADVSLLYLGGTLKRKERISARLADGLSYLYMGMAVLRYAEENQCNTEHQVHAKWALSYCFYHAQQSLLALTHNFPSRIMGALIRFVVFPFGGRMPYPSDKRDHELAQLMIKNNSYRNGIKESSYIGDDPTQPVARMEHAFQLLIKEAALYQKAGNLKSATWGNLKAILAEKVAQGTLSADEMETLLVVEAARWDAMQVDEFTFKSMENGTRF